VPNVDDTRFSSTHLRIHHHAPSRPLSSPSRRRHFGPKLMDRATPQQPSLHEGDTFRKQRHTQMEAQTDTNCGQAAPYRAAATASACDDPIRRHRRGQSSASGAQGCAAFTFARCMAQFYTHRRAQPTMRRPLCAVADAKSSHMTST
jgi:hypothetical protein